MKKYVAIIAVGVLFLMGSTLPCFADAGVSIQLETTVISGDTGSASSSSSHGHSISWYTPPVSTSTPVTVISNIEAPIDEPLIEESLPPANIPEPTYTKPIITAPDPIPPAVPAEPTSNYFPFIIGALILAGIIGIVYRKRIYEMVK